MKTLALCLVLLALNAADCTDCTDCTDSEIARVVLFDPDNGIVGWCGNIDTADNARITVGNITENRTVLPIGTVQVEAENYLAPIINTVHLGRMNISWNEVFTIDSLVLTQSGQIITVAKLDDSAPEELRRWRITTRTKDFMYRVNSPGKKFEMYPQGWLPEEYKQLVQS